MILFNINQLSKNCSEKLKKIEKENPKLIMIYEVDEYDCTVPDKVIAIIINLDGENKNYYNDILNKYSICNNLYADDKVHYCDNNVNVFFEVNEFINSLIEIERSNMSRGKEHYDKLCAERMKNSEDIIKHIDYHNLSRSEMIWWCELHDKL